MQEHVLDPFRHSHDFLGVSHERNERRALSVVALTLVVMVLEVGAGWWTGSMALLADGWHMSTHVAALGVAAFAYRYARLHAADARFAFGTGKVGDLAAFSSALVLALIALGIGADSLWRLAHPGIIAYREAIAVAAIGLAANLVSAWLLRHDEHAHAGHHHADDEVEHESHDSHHAHVHHHHGDHNLRAAYVHVLSDALVSILAIAALSLGALLGWGFLDPATGIVGSIVIARWSRTLLRDTGAALVDATADPKLCATVRTALEIDGDRVSDLHLWRVGPGHFSAAIAVVSSAPAEPDVYRSRLGHLPALRHVTIEALRCRCH